MSSDGGGGYGDPPKDGQFKKGQSGNPKGRPRNKINGRSAVEAVLDEAITLRVGENQVTEQSLKAVFKVLRHRALKGDIRAANVLLNNAYRLGALSAPDEAPPDAPLTAEDERLINEHLADLRIKKARSK